jgi:hypothetical protein
LDLFSTDDINSRFVNKPVILMTTGICPESSIGLILFGSLLGKLGHLEETRRCISLARSILDKFDAKECAGEAFSGIAEAQSYLEPLLSSNEFRVQGEAAAISVGDFHWACLCRMQHSTVLFLSGVNLRVVESEVLKSCQFMQEHKHHTSLIPMLMMQRTVWRLVGGDTKELSTDHLLEKVKNPRQVMLL